MRLSSALLATTLLTACEVPPNYVENGDISDAMARQQYKTVCVGLKMKDEKTREFAASKMKEITEPIARECVCEHAKDAKGGLDIAIATGLRGTDRDELAECLTPLVADASLANRLEAVVALGQIPARASRDALAQVAAESGAATEVRAAALGAIGGDPAYTDTLLGILASDGDAGTRAAAAKGLHGIKEAKVVEAFAKAMDGDADGAVRGEAMLGLKKAGAEGIDDRICKAMLEDPSPEVRKRAVLSFRGTKRKEAIDCLRERALTVEEDSEVRSALLTTIKSSPKKDAAKILCDAIPFWARNYMQEELPPKVPGADIIKAQNDRDWENSFDCIGKAYRASSGYSCFARLYVGHWYREVGGSSYLPNCPGYENPEIAGGE